MSKLLNNWRFVITFVILEALAIIGAMPLVPRSGREQIFGPYPLWYNDTALTGFMVIAFVLTFYFTRNEARKVRASGLAFVIGILLATTLAFQYL